MVDFAEAEARGMGIRAKLTTDDALNGLEFLLVLGIKDAQGGTAGLTAQLTRLFDRHHHYTDGLRLHTAGHPHK